MAWQTETKSLSRSTVEYRFWSQKSVIGRAPDQLHDEVGSARWGCAPVDQVGDIGVSHQREGATLRFEPRDDMAGVHARLDDLERDLAGHGILLLGHEHLAESPLTDRFDERVGTDLPPWTFGDLVVGPRGEALAGRSRKSRSAWSMSSRASSLAWSAGSPAQASSM